MKKYGLRCLLQVALQFMFVLVIASSGYCAESTADVSADAKLKEKIRQKILGQSDVSPTDDEYLVGYRDILNISVYGEGSMSVSGGIQAENVNNGGGNNAVGGNFLRGRGTGIEVRIDGRISVRHIGDVSVIGMTLTQIADYLKQLYSTIYDNPSLTVTLIQSNSLQYTVMGQVIRPGLYHLDFPLTIVRAVARAGGFTEWANSEITVIRPDTAGVQQKEGSKGESFKFDFGDFLKGQKIERNILIKSGDVIVVH